MAFSTTEVTKTCKNQKRIYLQKVPISCKIIHLVTNPFILDRRPLLFAFTPDPFSPHSLLQFLSVLLSPLFCFILYVHSVYNTASLFHKLLNFLCLFSSNSSLIPFLTVFVSIIPCSNPPLPYSSSLCFLLPTYLHLSYISNFYVLINILVVF